MIKAGLLKPGAPGFFRTHISLTHCKCRCVRHIVRLMNKPTKNQIETLQFAISTLMRQFKIADAIPAAENVPKLIESDTQAILFIAENPDCTASDVSAFLRVVPTTATAILDRLVQKGLINRTRTEKNRRIVLLNLTELGTTVTGALIKEQHNHCIAMLEKLDGEERKQFVAMMKKIAE